MASHFIAISLAIALLLTCGHAGADPTSMIHAISSIGVIDGHHEINPKHELAKNTVMLITRSKDDPSKGQICTGTVIEGCILTAGHCFEGGTQTQIFSGDKPNINRPIGVSDMREIRGEKSTGNDIAIIRPDSELPITGFTRADLAQEPLPKDAGSLTIIGYGQVGTKEVEDDNGKVRKVDYGEGRRRIGEMEFLGYGNLKDGQKQLSNSNSGNMVIASRTNARGEMLHSISGGDSGSPLYYEGKIYGTAVLGLLRNPEPLAQLFGTVNAAHVHSAMFTSMEKQRDWITNTLDKLQCGKTNPAQELFKLTRRKLFDFSGNYSSSNFDALSDDDIDALKTHIKKYLKLPADMKITISATPNRAKPIDVFDYTVYKPGGQRVRLSLSKDGKITE